jgi:hypothetical protein
MMDHDFLEPERLRAFVAVAETGNFTGAAFGEAKIWWDKDPVVRRSYA